MPFSSFTRIKEIQSLLRQKQLTFALSRDNITFNSISICEVETFEIDDLRTENESVGGTLQGFLVKVSLIVRHQSIFNGNDFVNDFDNIARGRWFVQIIDNETGWTRITPVPVSINIDETAFEGTRLSFQLITNNIEWLKHNSPVAPQIISPTIINTTERPVPIEQTNANNTLTFRLSNPNLSPTIENLVKYDIYLYESPTRTGSPIFSAVNLEKPNIIDSGYTATISALQRGKIYYGIARCKLGLAFADTLFELAIRFNTPSFIPPTPASGSTYLFTVAPAEIKVEKTTEDELADNCVLTITYSGTPNVFTINYFLNIASHNLYFVSLSQINQGIYEITAFSKNNDVKSESISRTFQARPFRELPEINNLSSNKNQIATGDPSLVGIQKYTISFTVLQQDYFGNFGGELQVKLFKNGGLVLTTSMSGPQNYYQTFYYTDSTSEGGTFYVEVQNANNQTVTSDPLTVSNLPLLTDDIYAHFTTRHGLFQNVNEPLTSASLNGTVARWDARVSLGNLRVENSNTSTQPILRQSSSGIKYLEFSTSSGQSIRTLVQPASQQSLLNDIQFTVYIVTNVIDITNNAPTIVTLKQTNISPNSFLGKALSNTGIRYINTLNSDVSTSITNSSSTGFLRVYGLRCNRDGSMGDFTDFLSATFNSIQISNLTINNMRPSSPIGSGRLVINGNLFRIEPDNSAQAYVQHFYELIIYNISHTNAQIQHMCNWLALANNF